LTDSSVVPDRILINIADFVVSLETDDPIVAGRLRRRYQDFLTAGGQPIVTIRLSIVPNALYIEPQPGPWVIETSYIDDYLVYKSYQEKGEVDFKKGQGFLEMAPEAHIENLLRAVYAWLCVKHDSLLLHAAGVIRDGQGFVFFGPSGAGKTTTSRLAARTADVVSDDLVIIRCQGAGCTLFGVPFKGELSEAPRANQRAPLRGIFRLRQDTTHYLEPIPKVKAVADLVASSPFIVRELNLSEQLVDVCSRIVNKIPVQELHFQRDDGFWKVIYEQSAANVP
jgi:hypothetical protein